MPEEQITSSCANLLPVLDVSGWGDTSCCFAHAQAVRLKERRNTRVRSCLSHSVGTERASW